VAGDTYVGPSLTSDPHVLQSAAPCHEPANPPLTSQRGFAHLKCWRSQSGLLMMLLRRLIVHARQGRPEDQGGWNAQ